MPFELKVLCDFIILLIDIMSGYLVMGFKVNLYVNCISLTRGFRSSYKQNSIKFLVEFSLLEYFWFRMLLNRSLGALFEYQHALRVLRWCFEKLGPTQGYLAIVTCRSLCRDVIILSISELTIFKILFPFLRV